MADQPTEKFWEMIEEFDTCMVTTRDGQTLRARPMAPRISRERGEILFITDIASHKVGEVEGDDQVACTFTRHGAYVAVSGRASVTQDRARIDEIWDAEMEAWMPQGKDGAGVGVFVVDPSTAEIWDVKANKVTQAWEFAKAYLGDQKRPDTTEHVKVDL